MEKWWPDIDRDYKEALSIFPGENKKLLRDQRDLLEEILSRIRLIEKGQSTSKTFRVHHLRVTGNQPDITNFLIDLRNIDFGGYPTVVQHYSANLAAVNVQSEGPIDFSKLKEVARKHKIELECIEI